jgi:hypothetical protein
MARMYSAFWHQQILPHGKQRGAVELEIDIFVDESIS